MKASVSYDDLLGSCAADFSDMIETRHGSGFEGYADYFKINKNRFKIVGAVINGTNHFYISFLCVDLERSTDDKEYILKMGMDVSENKNNPILGILFKSLEIVLYPKFDKKYSELRYDEECNYEDYHEVDSPEE